MIKFNLKKVMKEKKITLKELSANTGLSINTLSLLSTGKSKGIQFDTLEKLIQSLKCNVKDLIVLDDGFKELKLLDISVSKHGLFAFSKPDDDRIYNISCSYIENESEQQNILLTVIFTEDYIDVAVSGVLPMEFLTSGKYYYKPVVSGQMKEYVSLEFEFILQILIESYKKNEDFKKMFNFNSQTISINLLPYTQIVSTRKYYNENDFLNKKTIPAYKHLKNLVFLEDGSIKVLNNYYTEEEISEDDL